MTTKLMRLGCCLMMFVGATNADAEQQPLPGFRLQFTDGAGLERKIASVKGLFPYRTGHQMLHTLRELTSVRVVWAYLYAESEDAATGGRMLTPTLRDNLRMHIAAEVSVGDATTPYFVNFHTVSDKVRQSLLSKAGALPKSTDANTKLIVQLSVHGPGNGNRSIGCVNLARLSDEHFWLEKSGEKHDDDERDDETRLINVRIRAHDLAECPVQITNN